MSDASVESTRRALSLVEMLREGLREHALLRADADGKPRALEGLAVLGWGHKAAHFPALVVDTDDSSPAGTSCWRVAVVCEAEPELKLLMADVGEFLDGIGRRALLRSGFPEFEMVDDPELARPKYGDRQLVVRRFLLRSGTPVQKCKLCGAKTSGWELSCTSCKGLLNAPGVQAWCPRCERPTLRRSSTRLVSYTEYERTDVYSRTGDLTGYTQRPVERTRLQQATVCSVCGREYPHSNAKTKKEHDDAVQTETMIWLFATGFVVLVLLAMFYQPTTSNPSGLAPSQPPSAVRTPAASGGSPRPAPRKRSPAKPVTAAADKDRDERLALESRLGALTDARRQAADAQDLPKMSAIETDYKATVDEFVARYGDEAWRSLRTSLSRREAPPAAPADAAAPVPPQAPDTPRPGVMKRFWRGLKSELTPE